MSNYTGVNDWSAREVEELRTQLDAVSGALVSEIENGKKLRADLLAARGFLLADEERRKLTGDALHAEGLLAERDATIARLESEVASLAESSEWWRKACVRWQDWSTALLDEYGRQLRHGHHGSEPARRIIADLVGLAPGVPRCSRCGCFSSRHEVDDEELRNCLDCECTQYENLDARRA